LTVRFKAAIAAAVQILERDRSGPPHQDDRTEEQDQRAVS
jgi:hypothetical protein